jgi:ribosome biogenesis protein Tsr3
MAIVYEILVDKNEKPNKCTILPQAGRIDFAIRRFARDRTLAPMSGDWLLHPEGIDMATLGGKNTSDLQTRALEGPTLSVVDCNWRRLPAVLQKVEGPLPPKIKIPVGFATAYPRKNRHDLDPHEGLATIEAIFIAGAFLGCWDPSLFDKYHWKAEFFAKNVAVFEKYGLWPQ